MWQNTERLRKSMFYGSLMADIQAVKEVRLFGLGNFFRGRMVKELGDVNRAERSYERRVVLGQTIASVVAVGASAVVVVVLMRRAAAGELRVGDVTLYLSSVGGAQLGLVALVSHVVRARQAAILYDGFLSLLSAGPDLVAAPQHNNSGTYLPLSPSAGVEFRDVWFRYSADGPWVVRGVSFRLLPDQALGVVGLNGAGKSSLVKLLCRFYDPQRGRILWNGTDITTLDPAAYRREIAAIFQDFMSYDLTCAENISIGDLDSPTGDEAVRRAAARAGADAFITRLPAGYDTLLSRAFLPEDGNDQAAALLSGGQWQRLALARALMRIDRPLLVLDEPTAGLDPRAEANLQATLTQSRPGQAVLCISHRLSTVRSCHRILVLQDGEVAEQGTHDQLMARAGGLYRDLFEQQAAGYATSGDTPGSESEGLLEHVDRHTYDSREGARPQGA